MYKTITPYYEPMEILDLLQVEGGGYSAEMSRDQSGFLCGLIKKKKPKKIVEVGVASGGTTCIILNCLEKLGEKSQNTKMYSVDLSEFYYKDKTKKTGYLLEQLQDMLKTYHQHTLLTGKTLAERIDEIAPDRDIDFIILDTVHSLPGELLDFILCFPYLKKGATVVLHDIRLNHQDGEFQAFATKIVFDVVTADKYLLWKKARGADRIREFDSIGAFDITEDTSKYIADLFSALTITWSYLPSDYDLDTYRKVISKNYDDECVQMWDCAVSMQKKSRNCEFVLDDRGGLNPFTELNGKWKKAERVCIYGFGYKGEMYLQYAEQMGYRVDAVVLSDSQPIVKKGEIDIPVYHLSELPFRPDECCFINAGEKADSIQTIEDNIRYAGYYKIM